MPTQITSGRSDGERPGLGTPYSPPGSSRGRLTARSLLIRTVVIVFTGICGVVTLIAIAGQTGAAGLLTGVVLAAVPVFPVVATFLWLDRYEAEPAHLLVFAFTWGAFVATLVALVVNTASMTAIIASGGDPTVTTVFVAPLVEEFCKGAAVVLILLLRRREFDGVIDGIVYAGMAGVGFAFVENILYLGRTLQESGGAATGVVFLLRCVVSPFAHPLFTAAFGVGLGIAARNRRPFLGMLAALGGFVAAVFLHGAWNLSASSGLNGFVTGYVLLQAPVFIGFGVLALFARRREGRLIGANLVVYCDTGWLSPGEVAMLASLPTRAQARTWARSTSGAVGEEAMREFQDLGSELAFLRERMNRRTASDDAQGQELTILRSMVALRGVFARH